MLFCTCAKVPAGNETADTGSGQLDRGSSCIDKDNDGHGIGCLAGGDCDDNDPARYTGAHETCDGKDNDCDGAVDEGVKNKCGDCEPGCFLLGDKPFPMDGSKDPGVKRADNLDLDTKGDLVLKKRKTPLPFLWIANADGGTLSKIHTGTQKEVARYSTLLCTYNAAGLCLDKHGLSNVSAKSLSPSRTGVDQNFDVWVANRAFGGVPSLTKIAGHASRCVDRNSDGSILTSADRDGDDKITLDCDGDNKPDNAKTICAGSLAGKAPEFLGNDDECLLFSVVYDTTLDTLGRSVCIDGAGDAWVGTYKTGKVYRVRSKSGKVDGPWSMPKGHKIYGCAIDRHGILWTADTSRKLGYLDTASPSAGSSQISPPAAASGKFFYGIAVDGKDDIWLGGAVYRYQPDRSSWAGLGKGKWTWPQLPPKVGFIYGVAADTRGKLWAGTDKGKVLAFDIPQASGNVDVRPSAKVIKVHGNLIKGVGVDFSGHVWAIDKSYWTTTRLEVTALGVKPTLPSGLSYTLKLGKGPYTYSDFTGYGMYHFTSTAGKYRYQLTPCQGGKAATWKQLAWSATIPTKTSVTAWVRAGKPGAPLGRFQGPYHTSPVPLAGDVNPLAPNPAPLVQVELQLKTDKPGISPTVHQFSLSYACPTLPEGS